MSNHYSKTYNADGTESSKSLSEAMGEQSSENTPAEPIVRVGGVRTRFDASTGEVTVMNDGRDHRGEYNTANRPENASPLDSGMSQAGMPLSRGELTPDSIISHPALGGSMRLREALSLGWVKQTANGFVMSGDFAKLDAVPAAEQELADDKGDDEVSLDSVPGTSAGADLVHSQIRKAAGEPTYAAIVQAYVTGQDPAAQVAEIARRTGQSEAEVREATDGIMGEFDKSARAVASANGVRNFDRFVEWASKEAPDAALDAFHSFVSDHDASRLGRLSKQYSRLGRLDYSNAEVLSATFGDGITAREVNGVVMLRVPGRGEMSFERAAREGIIKFA